VARPRPGSNPACDPQIADLPNDRIADQRRFADPVRKRGDKSMIRKSGYRFSEKIMLKQ
jgi:hypothetical protein